MKPSTIDILRQDLVEDEGIKYEVYLDHLGLETCCIGHLIKEGEPEYGKGVGETVSQERCQQLFRLDIAVTIEDCKRMYDNWDDIPEEAQLILANMMFNLGYPRMSKFSKLRAGVEACDWMECAAQMEDSRWYAQVPNRARRLVKRMRDLNGQED